MIRVLSKQVSDKIAAGEVVDRPISIVKELVENSIDAGATDITVEIRNGGKTYIRITDNGCGIDETEVETAFLRHATSKIYTDEDLNAIETLGFRGEALSSIAAVSRVELITKTPKAKTGTSLKIYGGEVYEKKQTGCPDGTTVIVSDLFYNTPARLKFMKTDATESTLIIDFISKIAIAYPHIKVRLINNGNILFATNGKGDVYSSIVTVYSKPSYEGLMEIKSEKENMSVFGYISRPDVSKTNRRQQIFFVNGRAISNKIMEEAVSEGYRERLFEGRYPIAYIFFNINPELVDVNIHPNKKEVRFHQNREVKDFIIEAIRSSLLSEKALPQVKSDNLWRSQKKAADIKEQYNWGESIIKESKTDYVLTQKALNDIEENKKTIKSEEENEKQVDIKNILSTIAEEMEEKEAVFTENVSERYAPAPEKTKQIPDFITSMRIVGTVFNTYIAGYLEDTFYLIDQHAAHERIFYEQLMAQYRCEEKIHQPILTPIIIDVPYTIKAIENSWVTLLKEMGYAIEPFSNKSYIIKEIPVFMELSEAENFVNYFVENFKENSDIVNQEKIDRIITRSCKAAVKANDILSEQEVKRLLADLSKCDNPYSCPHGRPTFIKMTKYEIEKMFKRIQ